MTTLPNGVTAGATPAGVPHLASPFALAVDGSAVVVEQDTTPEVIQSVASLVGTRPGTRFLVPSFGVADPTFSGLDTGAAQRAIAKWEPRAKATIAVSPGGVEQVVVGLA